MNQYTDEYAEDYSENSLRSKNEFKTVINTGYTVEISETLSEGWKLVQQNMGSLIGFNVVSFLMVVFASILLSFIPIVGGLVNTAFIGVVLAGYYSFFIQYHTQEFATFSDFFESFKDALQLGVCALISTFMSYIPSLIVMILIGIVVAIGIGTGLFSGFEDVMNGNVESIFRNGAMIFFIFIAVLLITIPVFIVYMFYTFAPLIIMTHKKEFWPAMELSRKLIMKNLWGNAGLFFVLGIINFIGMIPLGLGLLVTIPLSYSSIFALYIKLLQRNGDSTDFASNFYGDEKAPLDAI